jgi:hypothetical protein
MRSRQCPFGKSLGWEPDSRGQTASLTRLGVSLTECLFPWIGKRFSRSALSRLSPVSDRTIIRSSFVAVRVPSSYRLASSSKSWWFVVYGFGELVAGKLSSYLREGGPFRCCIDQWQLVARNTRQFLKGWGANLGKEKKGFQGQHHSTD